MSTHTIAPDSDAEWPVQGAQSRIRLRPLTALLAVALIAVAGIYGGAELQKRHGTSASSSGGTASAAFASRGTGGFTGGPGGTSAASSGTSGTVTQVTAKTLYLTSSAGKLIKVSLTSKTTFTRTSASATGGLKLGDTATVQGTKNAKGVLVATSVTATAKGVTATFGGPGGLGGAATGGTGTAKTASAAG
jgi:hypothetical protein